VISQETFMNEQWPTPPSSSIDTPSPSSASIPSPTLPDGSIGALADKGHELLDRAVRGAHESIDRVAEGAAGATGALQQRGDVLREMSNEWTDQLRTSVREHPLAALGIAAALGMLLARVTR
jgi:ElaB/YqjD/DUF883 family membrane-anchored ribosome-binding protein